MNGVLAKPSRTRACTLAVVFLVAAASTVNVLAHRVIGRNDALNTALVQSPTASPVDLPIAIFNTGLSVICFRTTNTSTNGARIAAIGLELPGELSGFALLTPLRGLTIQENVTGVPGFPGITLDLVIRPQSAVNGAPQAGLPATAAPVLACVSGPFDTTKPIETMLNGVFVAFQSAAGSAADVGVWERRP